VSWAAWLHIAFYGAGRLAPHTNTHLTRVVRVSGCDYVFGVRAQVRSCSLDTWLPQQVAFMAGTGNAVAAAYWEARLRPGRRPKQADSQGLEVTPAVPTARYRSAASCSVVAGTP
jgi:Putative GTPase activating protein for Arf